MHILSIKPELILYFFMTSCLALLLFNVAYIFIDKAQRRQIKSRRLDMVDIIDKQIALIRKGEPIQPEHIS